MNASSRTASCDSASVTKLGEMKPLSNCRPSVTSSSVLSAWPSSTVMTPSRPTRSIASAISSPILASWAEMVATLATDLWSATSTAFFNSAWETASPARSMPRLSPIGLAPAATLRRPSRTSAWASTVAVVVPSPAMSLVLVATSLTSWAPRFSYGSVRSISLAMVTPSLVIVGAPNFLSRTTLRPRGPRVTLTVSASVLTPCSSRCRASSEKLRIFAIYGLLHAPTPWTGEPGQGGQRCGLGLLLDDREDVAGGEHQVLLAGVLDLGAAVLRVQDGVADLDVDRDAVALVVDAARADSEDGALLRLLLGGVRNDDARGGGGLGLVRLHDDAVLERLDADLGGGHGVTPLLGCAQYVSGMWWCLSREVVAVAGVNRPSLAGPHGLRGGQLAL